MLRTSRYVTASLACAALLGLGGDAFAQTSTPSATPAPAGTTTQQPTSTPSVPTTSTPATSTPAPSPSETSSAPNEYVESVPTASGQEPVTGSTTPSSSSGSSGQSVQQGSQTTAEDSPASTTSASIPGAHKKAHKKRVVTGQQRRSGRLADDPSGPAPPAPAHTSASTGGGNSDLIRLLVGMCLVTVALMTAAAIQRRREHA
jgi:hypothetical protein